MIRDNKTLLDYVEERAELVPVQVRLPKDLVASVKAKLQKYDMTFTELMRGACQWYLECSEEAALEKKKKRK